jgi:hypothetical protein
VGGRGRRGQVRVFTCCDPIGWFLLFFSCSFPSTHNTAADHHRKEKRSGDERKSKRICGGYLMGEGEGEKGIRWQSGVSILFQDVARQPAEDAVSGRVPRSADTCTTLTATVREGPVTLCPTRTCGWQGCSIFLDRWKQKSYEINLKMSVVRKVCDAHKQDGAKLSKH